MISSCFTLCVLKEIFFRQLLRGTAVKLSALASPLPLILSPSSNSPPCFHDLLFIGFSSPLLLSYFVLISSELSSFPFCLLSLSSIFPSHLSSFHFLFASSYPIISFPQFLSSHCIHTCRFFPCSLLACPPGFLSHIFPFSSLIIS